MDKSLAKLERGGCTAEVFSTALPGQFLVRYSDSSGSLLAEDTLSGVSTYKQREQEITDRLEKLCNGEPTDSGDLADAGEY